MKAFLIEIATWWQQKVHFRIATLVATIGTLGLVTCLLIVFVLAQVTEGVLEREAFAFDKTFLLWIHQFSSPLGDRLMVSITRLGDPHLTVPIVFLTIALLWWRRFYQEAKIFMIDCLGGVVLSNGLKFVFTKTRPDLWRSPIEETSYSYPSGHALGSMILYGFLAYLLATHYPKFASLIYLVAGLLIAAIGLSRLYLGVHWPTDIIGGYGIGFLWVMLCITMLKLQQLKDY